MGFRLEVALIASCFVCKCKCEKKWIYSISRNKKQAWFTVGEIKSSAIVFPENVYHHHKERGWMCRYFAWPTTTGSLPLIVSLPCGKVMLSCLPFSLFSLSLRPSLSLRSNRRDGTAWTDGRTRDTKQCNRRCNHLHQTPPFRIGHGRPISQTKRD